jgi:DNA-binding LacI/PurR family transcriptional regulator
VIGLDLAQGLQQRMGSYFSDLVCLSEREAARRGMEFEAVWLEAGGGERLQPYLDEKQLREYWGFAFLACRPNHPLLRRVRALKMRYVIISSHAEDERRRVWLDYREAIRLGLGVFEGGSPPLIVGIDNLRADVEAVLGETGASARQEYLSGVSKGPGYDTEGYRRALDLLAEGSDLSRVLLLDDVVAQGVTRAMLKDGYGGRDVTLAVICGRQEIIPLGLPVTFVAHDTDEEARHAFDILEQPPDKRPDDASCWRSGFRLVEGGV